MADFTDLSHWQAAIRVIFLVVRGGGQEKEWCDKCPSSQLMESDLDACQMHPADAPRAYSAVHTQTTAHKQLIAAHL